MTDQLTRIERKLNLLLEQKERVENISLLLEKLQEQVYDLEGGVSQMHNRLLEAFEELQRKIEGKSSKIHGGFS